MKIDIATEKSILVELSKEDMSFYDITYEELDYSNIPTRKIIFEIIEQIKEETGKTFDFTDNLQIDVMPDSIGGCLIIFTDCTENSKAVSVCSPSAVFETREIDDLIDCARTIRKSKSSFPQCDLFENLGIYTLVVRNCSAGLKRIISEFASGREADEFEISRIAESQHCLAEINGLEILCGKCS